jgi:hypothetical protein
MVSMSSRITSGHSPAVPHCCLLVWKPLCALKMAECTAENSKIPKVFEIRALSLQLVLVQMVVCKNSSYVQLLWRRSGPSLREWLG